MDEENKESKKLKKSFWKDKKNITIIILSFLLICFIAAYSDSNTYKYSSQIEELTNQVNELTSKNNEQNAKLEENQKQITNLQDANKLLTEEKEKIENEKQELNTKIEE